MALSKEEIGIRVGVDTTALKKGLSSASSQIKSFAKNVGVQLAAAFSFGAVLSQVKEVVDYVEQLSNTAGSLAVSTSFLQDVNNIGIAAGKSQEKMEKLLTIFGRGLLPGQDLETEFYKFLDELANTKDPAERLAKAFDRVGKSGKDLLDIARDGSAAFKELASTFQKLSESDIASINKLDATMDSFWNKIKINSGKAISWMDDFFQTLRDPRFRDGGQFADIGGAAQMEMVRAERRIKEMEKMKDEKAAARAKAAKENESKFVSNPTRNSEVEELRQGIDEWNREMADFEKEYSNTQQIGDMTEYEEKYKDYLEAKARKIGALKRLGEISAEVSGELKADAEFNKINAHTVGAIEDSPQSTPMQKVDDYVSKLKESQDAWKAKTDYSNFGKAIAKAQQEVAEKSVQKVSIVDIQE